jgi:hypothetical protein
VCGGPYEVKTQTVSKINNGTFRVKTHPAPPMMDTRFGWSISLMMLSSDAKAAMTDGGGNARMYENTFTATSKLKSPDSAECGVGRQIPRNTTAVRPWPSTFNRSISSKFNSGKLSSGSSLPADVMLGFPDVSTLTLSLREARGGKAGDVVAAGVLRTVFRADFNGDSDETWSTVLSSFAVGVSAAAISFVGVLRFSSGRDGVDLDD